MKKILTAVVLRRGNEPQKCLFDSLRGCALVPHGESPSFDDAPPVRVNSNRHHMVYSPSRLNLTRWGRYEAECKYGAMIEYRGVLSGLVISCFRGGCVLPLQSRSLGFARTMDLKYALGDQPGGDDLEEAAPYTQWPRLMRQILGASVLVSGIVFGCLVVMLCQMFNVFPQQRVARR